MTERHNPVRTPHRIRTRGVGTPTLQWEVFQTLLGFAFTVQQEVQKLSQQPLTKISPLSPDSLAIGVHPALQRIAACAQNLTESNGAALALGNADSMVCVARSGATSPAIGAQFDAFSGLSGECIRTGEAVICVNAEADPRVNYQACKAMDIASMLYLPLHARGKLIGMLGVFAAQPLHFSKRDLSCLQFTEGLVQEVLSRSVADPGPDTLAGILRKAQEIESKTKSTGMGLEELISEYNLQAGTPATVTLAAATLPIKEPVRPPDPRPAEPVRDAHVEPIFVGRIVDESVQESEPEPYQPPRPSRLPLITAAIVLLLLAVAGVNYKKLLPQMNLQPAPAATSESPEKAAPSQAVPPPMTPPVELSSDLSISSNDSTAVVTISLAQPITYDGSALANPDRVYFDLHGMKLTDARHTNFEMESGLVSRIRIAGYTAESTRIVFDLRQPATFETRLETNPRRLIITLNAAPASAIAAPPSIPAMGKLTIVIDPGHGGRDVGTTGSTGLQEKDVTLDIAKRLGLLLRDRLGANVVFTRVDDSFVTLDSRVAIANGANADFLVSIHGNSSSFDDVRGIETYYFPSSQEALLTAGDDKHPKPKTNADPSNAKAFAADVQAALLHGLSEEKQPIRDRGVRQGSFVVLREVKIPAVLAEVSFMSSRKDATRLESALYREQVASALYLGISRFVARRDSSTTVATLDNRRRVGTP